MARDWPRLPQYQSEEEALELAPDAWAAYPIEEVFEKLPIGTRYEQKSCAATGAVPVIDQSADGIIGFHNESPGVPASQTSPVVTFANHTCEMRVMRRSFSVIQNVFPLVGKPDLCETMYLYYSTKGRVHLEEYKGHFPDYRRLWIPLPPLPEQRAIAGVLGALDDKIEVNRKTARVLEGIARAVFTSWFVDFDPVRRRATSHPGSAAPLPADLAALFPTRLVDSPIGEVPEGWRVGTIGDMLSLSRDAIDPGDHPSEDFDHFSIPAFDTGQMPSTDRGETIKSQKFVVTADCVLVSKLNPRTPRVWLPPAAGSRRQVASTEFLVCTGHKAQHVSREFVYSMATSAPLIEHLTTHASGTSNSHQRVRPQDFLDFQCVEPPADVLRAFTRAASPVFGRIATARAQSATLAALRDALLPKLISGELRIADAEKIVGRST
jgi:hypothetical protein